MYCVLVITIMNIMFAGMPDSVDRLIMALGLGSTGHDYRSQGPQPAPDLLPNIRVAGFIKIDDHDRCPSSGGNGEICTHLAGELMYVLVFVEKLACIYIARYYQCFYLHLIVA